MAPRKRIQEPVPVAGPIVVQAAKPEASPLGNRFAVLYTPELAGSITDLYLEGQSLHKIANVAGMPSYGSILRWLKTHPEFLEQLEAARQIRAIHHEEEAVQVAEAADHKDDVPAARLKFDMHCWAAGVNDPNRYGKKTQISGDIMRPIQIQVLTGVPEAKPLEKEVASEIVPVVAEPAQEAVITP